MAKQHNSHTRYLRSMLQNALYRAQAAQENYTAALGQHGLKSEKLFYAADEVRAMRREHAAEIRKMQREHDASVVRMIIDRPKYEALANLAVHMSTSRPTNLQERIQRDWEASEAAAEAIVEQQERDREAARRATAEAIARAGRKARGEEN